MATKEKKKLSVIENHDYMSLVTPNGRFTMGYSGERASGNLVNSATAFDNMIKFVNNKSKIEKIAFGQAFRMLADEKVLSELWPEWNNVEVNPYKGDGTERVIMNDAKYKAKFGVGTIMGVKKMKISVKFDGKPGLVEMDFKFVSLVK